MIIIQYKQHVKISVIQVAGLLLAYDTIFFLENGFISEAGWNTGPSDVKDMMRNMFVPQFLDGQLGRIRPSFKAMFIDLTNELDAEQSQVLGSEPPA